MVKVALALVLLFLALLALRAFRLFLATVLPPSRFRRPDAGRIEGEMVRDPVCGVWIDRRLAVTARSGAGAVSVCSEECRQRLERRAAP